MPQTIGDRLKALRGSTSRGAFAEQFNVSLNTILRYENGETFPDSQFITKICKTYNLSSDYLIFGIEDDCKSEKSDNSDYIYIPRVEATLAAGNGSPEVSDLVIEELAFKRDWIRTKGSPKNMVLMAVRGDSMEPIIGDTDLVMLDQSKIDIRSGKIFAIGFGEYIFVKRLILEPGNLILRSENKEYKDINIDLRDQDIADQVRIIGRVIWWCHDER